MEQTTMIAARSELLDNPVWAALTTDHRALAEGGRLAKRYAPDVTPFAATTDRSPDALAALAAIIPPDGRLALVTVDRPAKLAGLSIERQAPILQMILETPIESARPSPTSAPLGRTDVPDMLDLTGRTQPGPFGRRTIELGDYIGIRESGILAAMAGERMRFDRYVEVSAVCVDPAYRGKGYAELLVVQLARKLQAHGLTPFLHVFASNAAAIALYRKLGFTLRRELFVTVVRAAS